jgi:hypothetical protein
MAQLPPGFVKMPQAGPTPPVAPQPLQQPPTPASGPQVAPQATSGVPAGFQPVTQEVPTRAQDPDYLDRMGNIMESREQRMERAYEGFKGDQIGFGQMFVTQMGSAIGALAELTGETMFTVLSQMTPDDAKTYLKEIVASGGAKLLNSEDAKQALEWYENLSPSQKDFMLSTLDLTLAGPFVKAVGLPLKGSKKFPDALGPQTAVAGDKKELANIILSQKPADRAARLGEKLNPYNNSILNTAISLGIKGSDEPAKMIPIFQREVNRLTTKITTDLRKAKNKGLRMSQGQVASQVEKALQRFVKENAEFEDFTNLSNIVSQAEDVFTTANKQFDGTPEGLYRLRQDMDKIAENVFDKNLFEGSKIGLDVIRVIRNTLNDQVDALAPGVRDTLRRQHYAIEGKLNAKQYGITQSPNKGIAKVLNFVERHPFIAGSAIQGGGMFSNVSPTLATSAALGLGAYGLTQPGGRRLAGEVLEQGTRGTAFEAGKLVPEIIEDSP